MWQLFNIEQAILFKRHIASACVEGFVCCVVQSALSCPAGDGPRWMFQKERRRRRRRSASRQPFLRIPVSHQVRVDHHRQRKSEAQSRVVKLEAAITALGENDPAVPRLREELQRVRSQAQVRPVDQRITWTQEFIARAQKRVEGMRTDLVKAQEAVAKAQETLRHEEALLRWRGTSCCFAGGVSQSTTVWSSPSSDSGTFCNRVGDVAGMCSGVASRERRVESRIVRRRRPRREPVQENQNFGNSCARLDVDGPRLFDSAQCDAVRFVGVDDQSSGFRSQSQCIWSRVLTGRFLLKCRRSFAKYGHRGERIGEAAHPGLAFLNFGRVRIPGSSGSRFAPLTQVDTVEEHWFRQLPPQQGWQSTSGPLFMSQTRRQCQAWLEVGILTTMVSRT